jgi:ABC-type lipoprotein export system ATPase subunit
MLVLLDNLKKSYQIGGRAVVAADGVTLGVAAGEFLAVRGPSGCGKTTLLLMAGGLLAPDAGTVTVDGVDPYRLSAEQRARFRAERVGFVFQQFHLVPYLSVLDNVLAPSLAVSGGSGDDFRSRACDLIERFGLGQRAEHVPGQLSTGERQRCALARALLNRPRVLLADEPTGNLDAENAEVVLGYLTEFARDGGAVLLVTHDDRAAAAADRVETIRDGRLVPAAGQ